MSDFVRELDAHLNAAAHRLAYEHPRSRAGRRARTGVRHVIRLSAAVAVVAVVAAGLAFLPTDREQPVKPAPIGPVVGDRPEGYGVRPSEGDLRYVAPPVLIAVGEGAAGRLEIVGYRFAGARGSDGSLCLDFVAYDRGLRSASGCGSPREHVQGFSFGRDQVVVTGATTQDVTAIRVHYQSGGRSGTVAATIARANRTDILSRLGISTSFTAYRATLPRGAQDLEAEALGRDGSTVWRSVVPNRAKPDAR